MSTCMTKTKFVSIMSINLRYMPGGRGGGELSYETDGDARRLA